MAEFPFFEPQEKTAVFHFVERHRHTIGMSKIGLVKRLGYANVNKGLRNYKEFLDGDYDQPFIVDNLSTVLVIDPRKLNQIIARAKRNVTIDKLADSVHEAQCWARNFKVHAIIETELNCPSPIFVAAMFDTAQLKVIYLDSSRYAPIYVQQALHEIPNRLDAKGDIPAFGAPTGITINIGPEMSIKYDLMGKETERLNWANRIRFATIEY